MAKRNPPAVAGKSKKQKPIRLGIVGVGRGQSFMTPAVKAMGFELVALCDTWKEKLEQVGKLQGVATYTDYDKFLEHEMDAVVLANYFHEHAPFAIKALKAGKHVMSETAACKTLAEGVELCRTVEQTGKVYFFAENYPFSKFCQEMRRIYRTGELGQVVYAEGEYVHPIDQASDYWRALAPTENHWRNWLPSTYYCTHALAPLMYMTDAMPLTVNGLSVAAPEKNTISLRRGDPVSVILCQMDNGAVFRLLGLFTAGHSCWYRLHGSQGAMEVQRGQGYFGTGQVRVWHEPQNLPKGGVTERVYAPQWPEHAQEANRAGHGGGDFWTNFHFMRAIRGIEAPFLNVYRGVAMSVVGPQAWRSVLAKGAPFDIPDFTKESSRKAYENDHFSPFPEDAGPGQPPPSIKGFNPPPAKLVKSYLKQVKEDRASYLAAIRGSSGAVKKRYVSI